MRVLLMNFGILVPMTFEKTPPQPGEYTAFSQACEDLGFHSLWFTDSVNHRTHLYDTLTLLTWAAAATSHIRIGTAVLLLALRHPLLVARAAASIDQLSHGRLTLGVSLGGGDGEYANMGIDKRLRVSRFLESVTLMQRLWTGEEVVFEGKHFRLKARIMPKPLQAGGIPLLFGGQAEPVLKRAGELADGWIEDTPGTAALFARRWAKVKAYARAAGRDDTRLQSGKLFYLSVDDNKQRARATLVAHMASMYSRVWGVEERGAFGPPEECAARIRELKDAGVGTIMLGMPSLSIKHLERVAREVVPPVS